MARRRVYRGERATPAKRRTKIGHLRHAALFGEPRKWTKVVDGKTGKSRMEPVPERE